MKTKNLFPALPPLCLQSVAHLLLLVDPIHDFVDVAQGLNPTCRQIANRNALKLDRLL